MITIYKVVEKIQQDREWIQKILIGGLLMFIPIVNIFALGYLYRYAKKIVLTGRVDLPAWNDWGKLFIDGLIFLAITILYGTVPALIAWGLSGALAFMTIGLLGWFPFFPLSIVLMVIPSLILLGIHSIIKGGGPESLFLKIGDHFKTLSKSWKEFLVGNFAFIGFQLLGIPLYGFAVFIGLLFLIPYTLFILNNRTSTDQ